jgi:hypothetical protein
MTANDHLRSETAYDHLRSEEKRFLTEERRSARRRLIAKLAAAVILPVLVFLAWRAWRET